MYETYVDDIFRYIYVHVNDTETAEDLTADTFTRAWNNLDTFDFKHGRAWLYKIARNIVVDHWRKKKPVPLDETIELPSEDEPLETVVDKQLDKDNIHAAMQKLPEEMRSVVTMRFLLGYSAKKTAESLDLSEANVRVLQFRALKKMKGYLS